MRVALASDHAGLKLRGLVREHLEARGLEIADLGTHTTDSVDYPDFAANVASAVVSGEARLGVLICGSGIGMSMAANRVKGVRAALCYNELAASLARQHNDANVLCLGERMTGVGLALAIVDAFFDAEFEGGRHERRVAKIDALGETGE